MSHELNTGGDRGYLRIATEEAFATQEQLDAIMVLVRSGHADKGTMSLWGFYGTSPSERTTFIRERLLDLGELRIGAMDAATRLSFNDVTNGDIAAAIISPNAPAAMEKYVRECRALGVSYVYDPSQQIVRLTPEALIDGIEGSRLLIANEYEFELIKDKTGLTAEDLLDLAGTLIITRSEHGSVVRTRDIRGKTSSIRTSWAR